MIYCYIRVSTDRQAVENQRHAIHDFCREHGLRIDRWVEETISGTRNARERKLGHLLRRIGKDDLIICTELSRLGRSLFMIMDILNTCLEKGCRVWTIKEGYRLGEDIPSKVLAFAFGLAAEIERQLIAARTKEALARKKAEGVVLGRPKGSAPQLLSLNEQEEEIWGKIKSGVPKTRLADELGCSRNTLYRWLKGKGMIA